MNRSRFILSLTAAALLGLLLPLHARNRGRAGVPAARPARPVGLPARPARAALRPAMPTAPTRLPYFRPRPPRPATRPLWGGPARLGRRTAWSVVADSGAEGGRVVQLSDFRVATRQDQEALARVKRLASSRSPSDLLLAALCYHRHGAFEEALPLFERLAELRPQEADLHGALAGYYRRAGRPEESKKALGRARKLRGECNL